MLRRFAAVCLLLVLPALSAAGCADPGVGGSGELVRAEGGGAGDHLILAGTPYEMGWWHGHLLKDRIRALHEEWQKRAFAPDGDLLSPATKERRAAALALVDPVLHKHLPEEVRREYEGLAAGCGLPVRTLLLTEMLTDILRFTESESRLIRGQHRHEDGHVWLWPDGPWRDLLASRWTWITRRPAGSARSATVLAWPGSLGGVLGARADGLTALAYGTPIEKGREGLAGLPFLVSLRRALERAADPAAVLAALSHTTAHRVLALNLSTGAGLQQLVALVGEMAKVSTAPDPVEDYMNRHNHVPLEAPAQFRAEWREGAAWVSTWLPELDPQFGVKRRKLGEFRVP